EQHLLEKNKPSWKDELREAIEYARDSSIDFDSFKKHLNDDYGIETKLRGKTLSFKHPERERFIRANKLGADYEKEGLENVFTRQVERKQEQHMVNMQSIVNKQETMKQENAENLQAMLINGHEEMEKSNNKTVKAVQEMQKANVEELNQINNEISTSMTNIKRNLNETVK